MSQPGVAIERTGPRRAATLADYREGPIAEHLGAQPATEIGAPRSADGKPAAALRDGSQGLVFAGYRLHELSDYRGALQGWFRALRIGGKLVIVVPHAFLAERQNYLPSRWNPDQKRLYTPRSLMDEVEEALAPNSYRVRYLGDDDRGYDYALRREQPPVGQHEVVLVLERIAEPAWGLTEERMGVLDAPDYAFEPGRTRLETVARMPTLRILAIKLDHLGDFIMGLPALERLRATFPEAEITLVVGSWNYAMAVELGIADHLVPFDIYPRNSSEEKVDVVGKTALFDAIVTGEYDLAIDLRNDPDTRFLLRNIKARVKAGMGTRAQFPHLDIFLPIDISRHEPEAARDDAVPAQHFSSQPFTTRNDFLIGARAKQIGDFRGAMIWGPYRRLRAGDYIWQAYIEIDPDTAGTLEYDIVVDQDQLGKGIIARTSLIRMPFTVARDGGNFEFRVWTSQEEPAPSFQFFGGRMIRKGADSVLHQSEYSSLLIELVSMRMARNGLFV